MLIEPSALASALSVHRCCGHTYLANAQPTRCDHKHAAHSHKRLVVLSAPNTSGERRVLLLSHHLYYHTVTTRECAINKKATLADS